MIVVDIINDEGPLFIQAFKLLAGQHVVQQENITWITEGTRWRNEAADLKVKNRLHYFDELDKNGIDLQREIERLNEDYDNFNMYACDRYLIKEKRSFQVKMLVYSYLFYEKIFTSEIKYYFTTGIAYTYNLISYQVAKKRGVKHISFYGTRYGNKTAVSFDIYNTFDQVDEMYETYSFDKVTPEMYAPIKNFVERPVQPTYMQNAINASTVKMIFIKEFFIRFKKYYLQNKHQYDFFTRNPFELSKFKLNKILQAKRIEFNHKSIFDRVNYQEKYFIFPLHMQPEASTLILAPFYVDQMSAIINISKTLPLNVKLYVKEHRSALGQHNKAFYNQLRKYANIKIISYKENMFNLIKHSQGTINLSSTVGLESLFLRKPAIILGDVFYKSSKLVYGVTCLRDLKGLLFRLSQEEFDVAHDFDEYEAKFAYYIHSLMIKSYPFEFNVAKLDTKERVMDPKNVFEFSECLKKVLS